MKKVTVLTMAVIMITGSMLYSRQKRKSNTWKKYPKGYEFKSDAFSCKINNSGALSKLKIGKKVLIGMIQVFARLKTKGMTKQARIFQNTKTSESLKVKKIGDKSIVIANGLLQSKKTGKVADFKQKITLSPNRIDFDYEITTTTPVTMKIWMPFCSLFSAKVVDFIGYALEVVDTKKQTGIYEIPKEYSKEKEAWARSLLNAKFIQNDKILTISLADKKNTIISIADGRSWKGKGMEILVRPVVPFKKKNVVLFPIGSKFKWSFSLKFSNN